MEKFSLKTLLIMVVILLIGIVGLFRIQQVGKKVSAAWFNDSWQYRKTINIGYSGASSNVQVKIFSNYDISSLVTAGKLQADLDDIRFTDAMGKNISYWIEDATNNSVDIWALIPSVARTGSLLYMYYGNPSATSASSTTNITVGGTMSVVNGSRLHTFLGNGTLATTVATSAKVLIVSGGGGGGKGGGGGAGGIYYSDTMSIGISNHQVIVGTGGASNTQGNLSSFNGQSIVGGGAGGNVDQVGGNGACGGGGGQNTAMGGVWIGGSGSIGYSGGTTTGVAFSPAGGGGGMGSAGTNGPNGGTAGNGGNGVAYSISGSNVYYAGGGGGSSYNGGNYPAGTGTHGGGNGLSGSGAGVGGTGTPNSGSGGGAGPQGGAVEMVVRASSSLAIRQVSPGLCRVAKSTPSPPSLTGPSTKAWGQVPLTVLQIAIMA